MSPFINDATYTFLHINHGYHENIEFIGNDFSMYLTTMVIMNGYLQSAKYYACCVYL